MEHVALGFSHKKQWGILLFFALCLFGHSFLFAQSAQQDTINIGTPEMAGSAKTAVLSGVITNPVSGERLIGATIYSIDLGMGTVTNDSGGYILILPVGQHEVIYRSIGLEEKVKVVNLYVDGVIDIGLENRAFSLEEILIKAKPGNQNIVDVRAGVISLNVEEIEGLPTFMGELDVLKSLTTLPGVSTIGEGAGGINVRGGKIDQNLVLFDDAQLFNSSHALGLFSVFNPDLIENFTLYKGSIPAQFGGRSSSVLDVDIKKGDYDQFKIKGGIGAISSRLLVEGPLWKGKTSYLLGGRVSYGGWVLAMVDNPDLKSSRANFYDLNAVISHRIDPNNTLKVSYYNSYDFFRYTQAFGYQWRTQSASLHWNSIIKPNFSSNTALIFGEYSNLQFIPEGVDAFNFRNGQRYGQLKQNFVWNAWDKHLINFGMEAVQYKNRPDQIEPIGDFSTIIEESISRETGREIAAYINDEFDLSPNLALSAGLRFSRFQSIGPDTTFVYREGEPLSAFSIMDTVYYGAGDVISRYNGFEPRLSLRYRIGEFASVKLSYNRMRQYIHLISNTSASTPVDVWQLSTQYIPPQISDNYSLGFFRNFNDNTIETSVEGFYRNIQNLVDYKDFADLLLNNHLETDLLSGKGKAYGIEFLIKRNEGRWTGWFSYTYSRSLIKVDGNHPETRINGGEWYPTSFDKPHDITLASKYELARNIFWGVNFIANTGRPITAVISSYELNKLVIPHFSERNAYRIPDYYRLDMSLTFKGKKLVNRRYQSSFTISVYNFLARKNAFSVYYQKTGRNFIPSATKLSVLGTFIPAISYNFTY